MRFELAGGARHIVRPIRITAVAAWLVLGPSLVLRVDAGSMIGRSVTQIEMPRDTEDRKLTGLVLGDRRQGSVAEITSIRLESLPEEGVEPMRLTWVVSASNTRTVTQVVNLRITLRDEEGKRLTSARGRLSIASRTREKEFEIKMKAKAAAWEASHDLELQADWMG